MDEHRTQRLTEAMREELEEMISYELSDPRIGSVTVSEVLVSHDLKKACVLVAALSGEDLATSLRALDHARGFLRAQLAQRLQLRRMPELSFKAAAEVPGDRIEALLKRIKRGRPRQEPDSQGNS